MNYKSIKALWIFLCELHLEIISYVNWEKNNQNTKEITLWVFIYYKTIKTISYL